MLFNSYLFILVFLPFVLSTYFVLNHLNLYRCSMLFLLLSSLFFYGYWNFNYVGLLIFSILVNYVFSKKIVSTSVQKNKILLLFGIIFNVSLLGYFKYSHFFIENVNLAFNQSFVQPQLVLPLVISFFTFTQIAYLVDTYRFNIKSTLLNYSLFVTYFPHLLAGPIIHHAEIMPQFSDVARKKLNYKNIAIGLACFSIGLFKKSCIADTLAQWVNTGYPLIAYASTPETWILSLCYTLQLYFDFSGYTDMAIGCSLMLNIALPENFNSPYKALNIQDFWRRWHMTLSRWLRDYIYIPLGGNKKPEFIIYCNLIVTFFIGGLWHGAGWNYIAWGLLHGFAIAIHRFWTKTTLVMPTIIAWPITFIFINVTWVFFRAPSLSEAITFIRKMFDFTFLTLPSVRYDILPTLVPFHLDTDPYPILILLPLFLYLCLVPKNTLEIKHTYAPSLNRTLLIATYLTIGILCLTRVSTFIYFQF